ncbi:hypothetical protein PVAND_005642 [Polypedilum vanderplanki]|uniref:Serine/threonine-protein phosphatase 1 regulatory subunit 10 n=1 Tax=Polypedilum vanderplanki TaxID=319348 RepID=A0A9J6C1M9_POLVA|nr:hypothetical protein PVAND_005642 [Polypedilum vanderplanki]
MPRIDPQQLLSCLTPLLAVNGGIKSSGEVIRLANLMQKYSKKLVSKCIYIQILKCTETDLLGQFMAANGWNLVHTWLNDSVNSANWPFVQEILEMLLLCPVDSNRLKSNHTPKIVKNLSMNISQNAMITALSKKLVEQWLKIAHQEKQMIEQQQQLQQNGINGNSNNSENTENNENNIINGIENNVDEDSSKKSSESIKYKISNNKDSGLVLSIKRSTSPTQEGDPIKSPDSKVKSEHKSKSSSSSDKDRDKKKSSSSSSHKSSSSSSSSKSSHRDKERSSSHKSSSRDKHHSSSSSKSSSSKSSSSNNSSSSSRDKDKEREKKKRDSEKEQAEKDKETLSFLTPLPSNKLQRIPKRQHSETSESEPSSKNVKSSETVEKKKPSISIENRRGDKPKTVKTLNSQFRDHGLAESPPPPPSRKTLKKPANNTVILPPPTTTTAIASLSSSKPISPPPNKKIHLDKALEPDVPERAGGVKLIKPKPMLVESTGFLDALDASAFMNKKDTKKRKRLPSGSSSNTKKDEPESPKIEAKPLKFYKDTLEENADDDKEKDKMSTITEEKTTAEIESPTKELLKDISVDIKNENKGENDEESKTDDSITVKKSPDDSSNTANAVEEEIDEKRPPGIGTGEDGPPGIIKNPNNPRKRAKRSIKWRSDEELVDIHYFPLEENERVNVTKTFMEQKHMEHIHERNALLGRRQDEQTSWRSLILIDNVPVIQYGSKSLEAKIQAEREKNTLQEVFFDGRSMSDSPQEPDFEVVDLNEPATIPLEDVTGNTDSVTSFKDVAWPAPKGDQPQFVSHGGFGNIFNNITPNITIPPAPAIALNPLAGLNLGALQPHENPALNFMGIIQQATSVAGIAPFMQPPPMIQNNYQSNNSAGNNFNNRPVNNYSTGNNNNNNNNNRNRSGSGSNWVRGNANQQLRRGMCHQYQRTGFCRNRNSGCPYIHER